MRHRLYQNKTKIVIGLLILGVLAGSFFFGGNYPKPGLKADGGGVVTSAPSAASDGAITSFPGSLLPAEGEGTGKEQAPEENLGAAERSTSPDAQTTASLKYSESKGMAIDPDTGKDKYLTDPVPEGKPLPVEPQNAVILDKAMTCTLSVRCDTLLDNMAILDKEKWELVPEDGVLFPAAQVTFYQGESVFDVLRRELKKAKIHMEFENTPMYNSAYIEGINNLYEFDGGELSGWMYKVNGWFPNYGASRYQIQESDVIEWVYTCDLGRDVGGFYSAGGS